MAISAMPTVIMLMPSYLFFHETYETYETDRKSILRLMLNAKKYVVFRSFETDETCHPCGRAREDINNTLALCVHALACICTRLMCLMCLMLAITRIPDETGTFLRLSHASHYARAFTSYCYL